MKFLDLDRDAIRGSSELSGNYYIYRTGSQIEVTAMRRLHKNELLAEKLSSYARGDKLMTKYCPTNKVYFSRNLIDNRLDEDFVSCIVDEEIGSLRVGTVEEYGHMAGILTFSGYLSANLLVEEHKSILCTEKMHATIASRVRIMSLGLIDENVFGLLYIPSVKGIKVAERGSSSYGVSPVTYKTGVCNGYKQFTIESWFDELTRIKEV